MNLLSAENISKAYSERWLFQNISLGIAQGEKLGLVGLNGTGKSTLLKVIAGLIASDTGNIARKEGLRIGYLEQQPQVDEQATVKEVIFDDHNAIAKVVHAYEDCLLNPDTSAEKMQAILEQMETLNAWDYESKVKEVVAKLGLPGLEQRFSALSGGQRKRVMMARLILSEPDLIIMDEPTNHLDLQAIEWLENYLAGQHISLIMVTHDRYFLDNVANEILELDRGKLYRYKGNYAYFLEKKAARELALQTEVEKARNLYKKELDWMRKQPRARGTKAKYRIEAFYEIEKVAKQDLRRDTLELDIKETRQGGKVLEVHNISKRFGELQLIDNFSYIFKKQDRIGVVGKNGSGKSTLLNILTGKLKPDTGEVIKGQTTLMGYFTQEADDLKPDNRIIDEVKAIAEFITLSDGSQVSASKFLDQFLFPPAMQYSPVAKLSGGEKKRLQLLKVLVKNPNFLILDEPTNDLDIDTLNVLEDFLEKFSGCLMLVSHDRYFMDKLVEQLIVFEGEGQVRLFNGNYSDYRNYLEEKELADTQAVKEKPVEKKIEKPVVNDDKRKLTYKEKQELSNLPAEIEKLEKEKSVLEKQLSSAGTDHAKLNEIAAQIAVINAQIENKTLRWLELES
ncbi:MAG TPA: ABC-F family ATP-binding cassette domain-containing protein [Cyclobacteriaceae bacterium]|nr:ABC-F family ATP-binding cassette domain-containing protein [Cyclobacteriaceae bacterium]